jgi:hypothetical protein
MAKQKTVEGGVIKQLETTLEDFFVKKLPALPPKIKEVIVKFSPWIAAVILVMSLPTILAALGLRGMMSGWGYGYAYGYGYGMAWWISIASMVLVAIALPGLFARKLSAWRLMFYSGLVMALYNLVTLSLGSLIIGTGISMYILFQIKSYYK